MLFKQTKLYQKSILSLTFSRQVLLAERGRERQKDREGREIFHPLVKGKEDLSTMVYSLSNPNRWDWASLHQSPELHTSPLWVIGTPHPWAICCLPRHSGRKLGQKLRCDLMLYTPRGYTSTQGAVYPMYHKVGWFVSSSGALNSIRASHCERQDPSTWATFCRFPMCINRKLHWKWSTSDLKWYSDMRCCYYKCCLNLLCLL